MSPSEVASGDMSLETRESTFIAPMHAPWYSVPDRTIVGVEHPYIIRNVDKAIASLGGESKLSKVGLHGQPMQAKQILTVISAHKRR